MHIYKHTCNAVQCIDIGVTVRKQHHTNIQDCDCDWHCDF